jgi:septal ring factor EnvC (AmiA/AmiB activator)
MRISSLVKALTFVAVLLLSSEAVAQKSEKPVTEKDMNRLKSEMTATKRRLDSLKKVQESINKTVTRADEQVQADTKVITRLSSQIKRLSQDEKSLDKNKKSTETELEEARNRYLQAISTYYRRSRMTERHGFSSPTDETQIARQLRYVRAVASQEQETVSDFKSELEEVESALLNLSSKKSSLSDLQKKRQTSLALTQARKLKQEQQLRKVRKTSADVADRLVTLKQAAEEMEALLARIQTEQKKAPQEALSLAPGEFNRLAGRMPIPVRGRIVTPYGPLVDSVTKLKSFSPGITIRAAASSEITSVAAGQIVYAGELRGYGQFVIVQHDYEHFTTYAGLGEILVQRGDRVESGTIVGQAREDGLVKFELRKGRESLDPLTWFRLDSF